MAASIYTEKSIVPEDHMLAHDLAETKVYLDRIEKYIEEKYREVKREWKFYNKKSGWILKMLTGKRNVLFIVPCHQYFRVAFTFGEKASEKILQMDLPEPIKKSLSEAKKYAEGRTIQMDIKSGEDLDNVLKMIEVKMAD